MLKHEDDQKKFVKGAFSLCTTEVYRKYFDRKKKPSSDFERPAAQLAAKSIFMFDRLKRSGIDGDGFINDESTKPLVITGEVSVRNAMRKCGALIAF